MAWPNGLIIGVTQYDDNATLAPFTRLNAGFDHDDNCLLGEVALVDVAPFHVRREDYGVSWIHARRRFD